MTEPRMEDPLRVSAEPKTRTISRLIAIDKLRGLVIVLMVLDHVREFFHYDAGRFDPTDPLKTSGILFATRWATHLCATTFVFLAGVSIFLQKANGKAGGELSAFLLKRGLWLILLELTVVSFGFNFSEPFIFFQVIGAIGASMICMSLLARLAPPIVLAIGCALVAALPFLIDLSAGASGGLGLLRNLLMAPTIIPEVPMLIAYPILSWLGVMCLGFGMGPIFRRATAEQRRGILAAGLAVVAAFLVLRAANAYGDPRPWQQLPEAGQTLMSFLNISKYPPSPDYVLITLGVSLLLFLALQSVGGLVGHVLVTFGRTPLFTYLVHIYIAHTLMLLAALATGVPAEVTTDFILSEKPGRMGWGFSLPITYCVWLTVIALMYPLSHWYKGIKMDRRRWWTSYL